MRPLLLAVALLGVAWSPLAEAIPESGHRARFGGEVLPYCLTAGQFGSFAGADGAEIAYARFSSPASRGALVILPGRSEPMLRYCEVIFDLRDTGYDVFILDHRGQGWSDRLIADRQRAHVVEFNDFVDDVTTFIDDIVQPEHHRRVVGLAHSMGGAILTRYVELHPDVFDSLVLSAPMHAVDTLQVPWLIAHAVAAKGVLLGLGEQYAPSQAAPDPSQPFAAGDSTHSEARWTMHRTIETAFPELTTGGSTLRWLEECLEGSAAVRAGAARLAVPILLFQADRDFYVERWGQDEVCRRAASCERRFVPGSFHALLQERDDIRDPIMAAIRSVLAR